MSFEVECPHCKEEVEIDGEDLPDRACDTEGYDCPACDRPVKLGWYATVTMSKA